MFPIDVDMEPAIFKEEAASDGVKSEDQKPPGNSPVKIESTSMKQEAEAEPSPLKVEQVKNEIKFEDVKPKTEQDSKNPEPSPLKVEQVKSEIKSEDVKSKTEQDPKDLKTPVRKVKKEESNSPCIDVKLSTAMDVGSKMEVDGDTTAFSVFEMRDSCGRHASLGIDPGGLAGDRSCHATEADEGPHAPSANEERSLSRGHDALVTEIGEGPPIEPIPFAEEEAALPEAVHDTPIEQSAAPRGTMPPSIFIKEEPIDVDMDLTSTSTKNDSRPNKRPRIFMDAVEITLSAEASRKVINEKIEKMRNPTVKKPKNGMTLSLDTIRDRLKNIGYDPYPIDLKKDILDVTVTRDFMSQHYGGNPQEMYPSIKKAMIQKTGLKNFLYPNLSYNPYCPEVPGAPGFIFHVDFVGYLDDEDDDAKDGKESDDPDEDEGEERDETEGEGEGKDSEKHENGKQRDTKIKVKDEEDEEEEAGDDSEPWILVSRLDRNVWQYQGQYVEIDSPPLSVAEWKQQSPKVRKTWIEGIHGNKWGQDLRGEIALRRQLGRQPTRSEARRALNKKDYDSVVTLDEIASAFDRGELAIYPAIMKCVGYNVDLQKNIAAKMPSHVPRPKSKKNKGGASKRQRAQDKQSPATIVKGKKRKRGGEYSSDSEEEHGGGGNIYKPRGTRSRPIVI